MINTLLIYNTIVELTGDIIKVRIKNNLSDSEIKPRLEELATVCDESGHVLIAQIIHIEKELVTLQVYGSTKGISMNAAVSFLGHGMQINYSKNILGRVFNGHGVPVDKGPNLENEPKIEINNVSINPVKRQIPSQIVRTNIPMIDIFNCLVESQKISIFAKPGEPYNILLKKIAIEAQADIVIFGGMGLLFDDYYLFRKAFEDAGVFKRSIMLINLGTDPVVERVLVPDLALTLAEKFATEHGKKVLVLLTDMTSFADALKEIGVAMEKIPSNRGYSGDLYSQLAKRYEKACAYKNAGSVTILSMTTMPGGDLTHPVPDNTGYITEGQYYLEDNQIDPFGSLSRLKQYVIDSKTREDHSQVANALIRLYSESKEAEQKASMAFELSDYDNRLLQFGALFRKNFLALDIVLPLEKALDLGWKMMRECFSDNELLIKQDLINKYGLKV